ncbi:MAG: SDR family oxidoreductase [Spirochaetota bacterium]
MSYTETMFSLNGVSAVVTGGAGVLPGAMAKALLWSGAEVTIWGRGKSNPVGEAVERLKEESGVHDRVHGITVDTADEDAVSAAFEETCLHASTPNLLVNGVGGNQGKSELTETDVQKFRNIVDINLIGGLLVPTKIFAAKWIQEGMAASIINLSSMAAYTPLSGVGAYGAAKAAVQNMTVGNARELAPHRIRVNAIAPGFFVGNQNRRLLIANDETGELTDRGRQIIDRTPAGRFGEYGDIEGATVFLASAKASGFITGVTLPVDGGYLTDNV